MSTQEFNNIAKEVDNMSASYEEAKKAIDDNKISQLSEIKYSEKLIESLDELVDANGKVKEGCEQRADIILRELNTALGTEYERNGNLIKINGEVVNSYKEIKDNIGQLIESKKKQIELEAKQEIYKEVLKEQLTAEREIKKAQDAYNKSIQEYNKAVEYAHNGHPFTTQVIEAKSNMEKMKETLNEAQEHYKTVSGDLESVNEELTNAMVQATGEFSAQMIEQGQVSKETLITMAKEQSDTFLTELNKMDEGNQALYLGMVTTADTMSPQIIEKWKELASKSEGEYLGSLSIVEADTRATILNAITTTENMTDNMAMTWSSLATESKNDFNEALSSLPDDVKGKLLASIANVTGLDTTSREAYKNLSENAKAEFNKEMESLPEDAKGKVLAEIIAVDGLTESNRRTYEALSDKGKKAFNTAMNGMDIDTRNKVQSAINEISAKSGQMYNESYNTANKGREGAQAGSESNGGSKQIGNWFVQGLLNALTGGQWSVWQAGYNLVKQAIFGGNKAQQTGSPAKETIKMGNYFTEGYIVGLKKKQEEVRKATSGLVGIALGEFKELNQGIKINTRDFAVDTNQYVNYSAIRGQIQAQSQVNMNENIANKVAEASYNAFVKAMRDEGVNIEVKAEEGIIFKKVQNSAREYTMQTGEPAFGY